MRTKKPKPDPRPRSTGILRRVQREHRIRRTSSTPNALLGRNGAVRRVLDLRRG